MSDEFSSGSDSGQDVDPVDDAAARGATERDADPDYVFGPVDDVPLIGTPAREHGPARCRTTDESRATRPTNGTRMNGIPHDSGDQRREAADRCVGVRRGHGGDLARHGPPHARRRRAERQVDRDARRRDGLRPRDARGPAPPASHVDRRDRGRRRRRVHVRPGPGRRAENVPAVRQIGREVGVVRPEPTAPPTTTATPPDESDTIGSLDGVAMRYSPVEVPCGTEPDCGHIRLTSVGAQPLRSTTSPSSWRHRRLQGRRGQRVSQPRYATHQGASHACSRSGSSRRCVTEISRRDPRHPSECRASRPRSTSRVRRRCSTTSACPMSSAATAPARRGSSSSPSNSPATGTPQTVASRSLPHSNGRPRSLDEFSPSEHRRTHHRQSPMVNLGITLALDTSDELASNNSVSVTAMLSAATPNGQIACPPS